jgi:uncharacterized iron-regulated membrane protein
VAFLGLALIGIILWLPRRWNSRALRQAVWFRSGLTGKARDFSWHNVIGFWCFPLIVVITVSGAVISYRWASDLVYRVAGSPVPPKGPTRAPRIAPPSPNASYKSLDGVLQVAMAEVPAWEQITVRFGAPGRPSAGSDHGVSALTLNVRERDASPRFASITLSIDPFTGAVLAREDYASSSLGRKLRLWLRFLHTGEALGLVGQTVVALASLGAVFLAYTGLALSFRRLFRRSLRPASRSSVDPSAEMRPDGEQTEAA